MQYNQARSYLDHLQLFKIKLGLEEMTSLLSRLDSPHESYPTVHLAGTNGKGSVAATLAALLSGSGYRVGVYSSPHLQTVRERFRINDRCIAPEEFAHWVTFLDQLLGNRKVTYFEFTTALAFLWFKSEAVDLAVIETGLGGRLDATNVICPIVSAITTVDYDHQQHLGSTLELIAREKAGIVKPSVPVVTGHLPREAFEVVERVCSRRQTKWFYYGTDFSTHSQPDGRFSFFSEGSPPLQNLQTGLVGAHQVANTAIALKITELLNQNGFSTPLDRIRDILPKVRWPGRMEILHTGNGDNRRTFVLDGAHNRSGVKALTQTLGSHFPARRLILIWGNMKDKELGKEWLELLANSALIIFSQAEEERSAEPVALARSVPVDYRLPLKLAPSVDEAIRAAIEFSNSEDIICVAGSLYLVGKARSILIPEDIL